MKQKLFDYSVSDLCCYHPTDDPVELERYAKVNKAAEELLGAILDVLPGDSHLRAQAISRALEAKWSANQQITLERLPKA